MLDQVKTQLQGEVFLAGDKSLAHRALLFASRALGDSYVTNFPRSNVINKMLVALNDLGIDAKIETDDAGNDVLHVHSDGWKVFPNEGVTLDCGNSATTMRLLAGALVGSRTRATLIGSDSLQKRPMGRIVDPLRMVGSQISLENDKYAPISIDGFGNFSREFKYSMPLASAQVKTSIILGCLKNVPEAILDEPGISRDHTERMLSYMGAEIETKVYKNAQDEQIHRIKTKILKHELRPLIGMLPGDISSAAFLMVAAAIVPNSYVIFKNCCVNPTRTGIFDCLRRAGCFIKLENVTSSFGEPVADVVIKSPPNHASLMSFEVSGDLLARSIDEIPAIAILMANCQGKSIVKDGKELRVKESDRISSIIDNLKKLDVECYEQDDGFEIVGKTDFSDEKAFVETRHDHRIAMAFSLLNLIGAKVELDDENIINESFPAFETTLKGLA